MTHPLEAVARDLFTRALLDQHAGELLEHLLDGDAATVDPATGDIVYRTYDDEDDTA